MQIDSYSNWNESHRTLKCNLLEYSILLLLNVARKRPFYWTKLTNGRYIDKAVSAWMSLDTCTVVARVSINLSRAWNLLAVPDFMCMSRWHDTKTRRMTGHVTLSHDTVQTPDMMSSIRVVSSVLNLLVFVGHIIHTTKNLDSATITLLQVCGYICLNAEGLKIRLSAVQVELCVSYCLYWLHKDTF